MTVCVCSQSRSHRERGVPRKVLSGTVPAAGKRIAAPAAFRRFHTSCWRLLDPTDPTRTDPDTRSAYI